MGFLLFVGIVTFVLIGLYLLNKVSKILYEQHERIPIRDVNKGFIDLFVKRLFAFSSFWLICFVFSVKSDLLRIIKWI